MTESNFNENYNKYVKEIYRFALFKTNSKEDAEDIVSEVFIKFSNQDIQNIQNPRAWLYKVTRNTIYDKFVRQNVIKAETIDQDYTEEIDLQTTTPKIEDIALDEAFVDIIINEIKNLDSTSADIILMKVWDELTFSEIAEAVKLTENNVKQRFYRGIEKVKRSLNSKPHTYKMRSITVPILLAGIIKISATPGFQLTGSQIGTLSANLFNQITFTTMTTPSLVGKLLMLTQSKIAIAAATTTMVAVGSAGYVAYNETSNNNEKNTSEIQLSDNTPVLSESECTQTFLSPDFPYTSFDYDSCRYNLEVKKLDSNQTNVKLSNAEGALTFNFIVPGPTGVIASCKKGEATIVNEQTGMGRITIASYSYEYYDSLSVRGSSEFNELVTALGESGLNGVDPESDYCFTPDISAYIRSSLPFEGAGSNIGGNLAAYAKIKYEGVNVTDADDIISTFRNSFNVESTSTSKNEPSESELETIRKNTTWTTYTHPEFKFSFSYPEYLANPMPYSKNTLVLGSTDSQYGLILSFRELNSTENILPTGIAVDGEWNNIKELTTKRGTVLKRTTLVKDGKTKDIYYGSFPTGFSTFGIDRMEFFVQTTPKITDNYDYAQINLSTDIINEIDQIVSSIDVLEQVPVGWNYKYFPECGIKMLIPPEAETIVNNTKFKWTLSQPTNEGLLKGVFTKIIRINYQAYSLEGELLGNGDTSNTIEVYCIPNANNFSLWDSINLIESEIAKFNQNADESVRIEFYNRGSKYLWGRNVFNYSLSGGMNDYNAIYDLVATPNYLYSVLKTGNSNNTELNTVIEKIYSGIILDI